MTNAVAVADSGEPRNSEQRKETGYLAFDWLRMALAGMVALAHLGVAMPAPFGGHFAVEVFLALSGWLIGGILLRSTIHDLPRFFYNRTTRIWFPYALAIILLYGFAAVREGISLNWIKYLFYDVTFTHYNFVTFPRAISEMPLGGSGNQFWSLSVEEQFYLLAPIVMFALPFGKKLLPWIVLGMIATVLQSVAAPLSIGVVGAVLHRDYGDWHMARWARPLVIASTILLGLACHGWDYPQLRAMFAGGIILSLAFPGRRNALGLFLGGISYPFYLNHWIGGFVAHGIGKRIALTVPVSIILALVISFLVSTAAWAAVDRPTLKLKRRLKWFSPALGKRAAALAYGTVITGLIGGLVITASGG